LLTAKAIRSGGKINIIAATRCPDEEIYREADLVR
jgi:hypothetical protein